MNTEPSNKKPLSFYTGFYTLPEIEAERLMIQADDVVYKRLVEAFTLAYERIKDNTDTHGVESLISHARTRDYVVGILYQTALIDNDLRAGRRVEQFILSVAVANLRRINFDL